MKEVSVQAVPMDPHAKRCIWYACECSACGAIAITISAMVTYVCQDHLRDHGAVGIVKQ